MRELVEGADRMGIVGRCEDFGFYAQCNRKAVEVLNRRCHSLKSEIHFNKNSLMTIENRLSEVRQRLLFLPQYLGHPFHY